MKWLGRNVNVRKSVISSRGNLSANCAKFVFLDAVCRINAVTKQSVSNPYRDAVSRTDSREVKPILFKKAAGSKRDLPETYKPAPYSGKSVTGLLRATQFAALPYVPSSGPRALGLFGNIKNATTLTMNEAKTIAYSLLFKVVNFTLKSFIFTLTINRS
jgi:hypothetical protein